MSLLRVQTVSKRFGGLLAVDSASLDVPEGTIVGLIGPNGAGKTTLFSIISGFVAPTSGTVIWDGADITLMPPHKRAQAGIARTFQIVQPFAGLSVVENIAVGAYLRHPRRLDATRIAAKIGQRLGLGAMLETPASALTVAGRKRLELARALATGPRLLLLDEVLAGLNPSEIRDIIPLIHAIKAEGVTILMIEHVMQAVMNLCEHVLAQGKMIAAGKPSQISSNPAVIEAYLGHGAAARMQAHA
jgi:branched-chain amino acid transport system ATP-binding protein